jgi:uncharacterized membrane protein (DUF2068 family)
MSDAETQAAAPSGAWAGWVLFAALLIVLAGVFNTVQGLVALLNDDYYLVTEDKLLVLDITAWGWVMLVFGVLQMVAGVALNRGVNWARFVAIGVTALHMIAQLTFSSAHPIWSVMMIALDIIVIFALTARWDEAVAGLDSMPEYGRPDVGAAAGVRLPQYPH